MQNRMKCRSRATVWPLLAAALLLAMLSVALFAGPAAAQIPDYGRLLGVTGAAGTASESTAAEPRQSLPATGAGPSAADYARLSEAAPEPMLGTARKAVSLFRERLAGTLNRTPEAFHAIGTTLAAASPTGHEVYFLRVAIFAALLLVAGRAATEFYIHFVARPVFIRATAGALHGYAGKLPVLVYRVLLTAIGLVMTLVVASMVGLLLYEEHEATQLTVITIFATYAVVVLADTVWRMMLAPFLPKCRLPEIGDAPARSLYRWLTLASGVAFVTSAFCYWIEVLGLPREVHVLLTVLMTLVTAMLVLMLIRANRAAVSGMILAGQPRAQASWLARAGAAVWAPLVSLYLIVTWGDLSFRLVMGIDGGPSRLLVPYMTLTAGLFVYGVANYAIERIFADQHRMNELNAAAAAQRAADAALATGSATGDAVEDEGDDEGGAGEQVVLGGSGQMPTRRSGMRTMEDLARRVASLFALGASAYALAVSWAGSKALAESL